MTSKTGNQTVQEIKSATAALRGVRESMQFLVPISDGERANHRAAHLGPKRLRQLENRLEAARTHRDMLPPTFDLKGFERDTNETLELAKSVAVVNEIRAALLDTLLVAGNRASVASATAYG